jgi:ribosome-associated translation inhibitor RaiA
MRIHVLAEDGISPQARTYAEYRVFAALSQIVDTEQVRDARVVLRPMKRQGGGEAVSCTVTVALDPAGALRVRTAGAHAYAAINRAVDLLRSKKPQKVSVGMPVESASR